MSRGVEVTGPGDAETHPVDDRTDPHGGSLVVVEQALVGCQVDSAVTGVASHAVDMLSWQTPALTCSLLISAGSSGRSRPACCQKKNRGRKQGYGDIARGARHGEPSRTRRCWCEVRHVVHP